MKFIVICLAFFATVSARLSQSNVYIRKDGVDISYSINHSNHINKEAPNAIVSVTRDSSIKPAIARIPPGVSGIVPTNITPTSVTTPSSFTFSMITTTNMTSTSVTPSSVIFTNVTPTNVISTSVTPSSVTSPDLVTVSPSSGAATTSVAPQSAVKVPAKQTPEIIKPLRAGSALRFPGHRIPPHHKSTRRPSAYVSSSRRNLSFKPVQNSGLYRNPFHGLLRRTNPAVGLPYGLKYQAIYPYGSPHFRKNRRVA